MKIVLVVLPIILFFIFHCNVAKAEYVIKKTTAKADHENYVAIAKKIRYMEKYLKKTFSGVYKMILPYVVEFIQNINVTQECMKNCLHIVQGMKNIKKSAIQFLDASGKVPDGMMFGSITAVGHYEQCLAIEVKSTRKKDLGETLYQGQYCTLEVKPNFHVKKPTPQRMHEIPEELKEILESDSVFSLLARYINFVNIGGLRVGVCLPTGCTLDDINNVLNLSSAVQLELPIVGDLTSIINITAASCEKKEKNNYTPVVIFVLTFYALICLLVLAGSVIDFYSSDKTAAKSKIVRALLAFSLVTNFKKFCAPSQQSDKVSCLNGMKFFGLTWVVLGHNFIALLFPYNQGYVKTLETSKTFAIHPIINGMFAVDTFFVIGSFLVSFLFTKSIIKQKKRFSVLMYIVLRLLRLYPAYLALLSTVVIFPLISSGPFWKEIMAIQFDPCFKNWWTNLLFINNIYQPAELCYIHTWYITVDIQLYIISLLFLIPLMRSPKIGLSLIFFGIIGHLIFCGIITYVNEYPPAVLYTLMTKKETFDYLGYMHYSPFTHLGPYGIGLLLGYIYAMNPNIKMSRLTQVLGWCIAFTCSFSVLYGSRGWYLRPMPQYLSVIYASLSKTVWSIGPAWIIFCCATGHGGIMNWILSLRVFTHLSRLTFSSYLFHLLPMTVLYASLKTQLQADLYFSVSLFITCLCMALFLGFVVHMFIEAPFANLVRVFLLEAKKDPESIEKERNVVDNGSKEEKIWNIVILKPSEKDFSTKL